MAKLQPPIQVDMGRLPDGRVQLTIVTGDATLLGWLINAVKDRVQKHLHPQAKTALDEAKKKGNKPVTETARELLRQLKALYEQLQNSAVLVKGSFDDIPLAKPQNALQWATAWYRYADAKASVKDGVPDEDIDNEDLDADEDAALLSLEAPVEKPAAEKPKVAPSGK